MEMRNAYVIRSRQRAEREPSKLSKKAHGAELLLGRDLG